MTEPWQLLAMVECLDVVAKVRRAADDGDVERFVGLFAPDGVWLRPGSQAMKGRAAIRATMESRPAGRVMRHVSGGADAELDSTDSGRATVHSQATIYAGAHEGELPAVLDGPDKVIEYRDELIRTPEGWRIALRQTTVVFLR